MHRMLENPYHLGSSELSWPVTLQPLSFQSRRTDSIRAFSGIIGSRSCNALCKGFRALLPLLIFLSPLALAQSCHPRAVAVARTFTVPFHNINGVILLDAKVNDKPAVLLLDTGAGLTVLSPDAAGWSPADLKKRYANRLAVGIDGATHSMGNTAATLEVGRALTVTPVAVADLHTFAKTLNIKLDGILGQDVLRGFSVVRIDYKSQLITLEE
jgi:hypothetical protein